MKEREFNPREHAELMFNPTAFVRYRNGREIVLSDLTIREIVEAMETPRNAFLIEEE